MLLCIICNESRCSCGAHMDPACGSFDPHNSAPHFTEDHLSRIQNVYNSNDSFPLLHCCVCVMIYANDDFNDESLPKAVQTEEILMNDESIEDYEIRIKSSDVKLIAKTTTEATLDLYFKERLDKLLGLTTEGLKGLFWIVLTLVLRYFFQL